VKYFSSQDGLTVENWLNWNVSSKYTTCVIN